MKTLADSHVPKATHETPRNINPIYKWIQREARKGSYTLELLENTSSLPKLESFKTELEQLGFKVILRPGPIKSLVTFTIDWS